ncbi:MAG: hypothetical protein N2689_14805 [Verrucomicrobiae bacterium]|nr:hypothetical protein [Verrucomicrobiae bacterium]
MNRAPILVASKKSGPSDSVREDGGWEIIYGRGLDGYGNGRRS